jgi:hypothetical protein
MLRSRRLFFALGLLACLLLAGGTVMLVLLPRETTLVLFDGNTTSGWLVVGDAEVKGGALVLGGNRPCLAQIADDLGSTWQLHIEYSTENATPIQFQWTHRQLLGTGAGSVSLDRTSRKPGEWIEAVFEGKSKPAGGEWVITCKSRVLGEAAFTERVLGGSAGTPHSVFVAFDTSGGQKMYLRNINATTEAEPFWAWLLVSAGLALGALLAIALVIRLLMNRISRPSPGDIRDPRP